MQTDITKCRQISKRELGEEASVEANVGSIYTWVNAECAHILH